jgi:hypothetical protein
MAHYTKGDLEEFYDAYAETALWSSNDESDESGGEPMDKNYSVDDIAGETEDKMVADCKRFLDKAWPFLEHAPARIAKRPKMEMAGYHFWLSRNGHGVGFDDGDWPDELGKKLDDIADRFGEVNLCVGDDGKIHQ